MLSLKQSLIQIAAALIYSNKFDLSTYILQLFVNIYRYQFYIEQCVESLYIKFQNILVVPIQNIYNR